MITSPASHNYPLSDRLSHDVSTQTVVTHKNGSSFASKICNIQTKILQDTEVVVKHTYETINAHPIISAFILILSLVVVVALTVYNYKLCTNREATHPIIVLSTLVAAVVAALITVTLTTYDYKSYKNRKASFSIIVAFKSIVALAASLGIVALVALVAYVTLTSYHYKLCRETNVL